LRENQELQVHGDGFQWPILFKCGSGFSHRNHEKVRKKGGWETSKDFYPKSEKGTKFQTLRTQRIENNKTRRPVETSPRSVRGPGGVIANSHGPAPNAAHLSMKWGLGFKTQVLGRDNTNLRGLAYPV